MELLGIWLLKSSVEWITLLRLTILHLEWLSSNSFLEQYTNFYSEALPRRFTEIDKIENFSSSSQNSRKWFTIKLESFMRRFRKQTIEKKQRKSFRVPWNRWNKVSSMVKINKLVKNVQKTGCSSIQSWSYLLEQRISNGNGKLDAQLDQWISSDAIEDWRNSKDIQELWNKKSKTLKVKYQKLQKSKLNQTFKKSFVIFYIFLKFQKVLPENLNYLWNLEEYVNYNNFNFWSNIFIFINKESKVIRQYF